MRDEACSAAFVAVGAHLGKRAYIPAGSAARMLDAVALLRGVAGGEPPLLGRRVAVYGGGNTAMDAARTARRLGAEEAVVIYRRTRDRMPAHDSEVQEALEEGVRMQVALDRPPRRRRPPDRSSAWSSTRTGSRSRPASSRSSRPTRSCSPSARSATWRCSSARPASRSTTALVHVGPDLMTGRPGVFAGGDIVPAERTVTMAIGHGRTAARTSTPGCAGRARTAPRRPRSPSRFEALNPWYYSDAPRTVRPQLELARRQSTFDEVVGGLDASNALFEARRCLSCGSCFACDNCFGVCPDNAVIKLDAGRRVRVRDRPRLLQGLRHLRTGVPVRRRSRCTRRRSDMAERPRIVVAGGGVAALEALLALHELDRAARRARAARAGHRMLLRPASVAEPFGLGGPPPVQLAEVAAYCGAGCTARHPRRGPSRGAHRASTGERRSSSPTTIWSSRSARARRTRCRGRVPFAGPLGRPGAHRGCWTLPKRGDVRTIAFVAPSAVGWTLPVYELALMAAADLRAPRRATPRITVDHRRARAAVALRRVRWRGGRGAAGRPRDPACCTAAPRPSRTAASPWWSGQGHAAEAAVVIPPVQGPWIRDLAMDDQRLHQGRRARPRRRTPRTSGRRATPRPSRSSRADWPASRRTPSPRRSRRSSARPPSRRRSGPCSGVCCSRAARRSYLRAELDRRGAVRRRGRHRDCAARSRPARCGGHPARWPAAIWRPISPPPDPARWVASRWSIVPRRRPAQPPAAPATRFELALLLADADAAAGDFRQALHALDAAAALSGGVLPAAAARRRDAWRPRLPARPRPSHIEIEEEP